MKTTASSNSLSLGDSAVESVYLPNPETFEATENLLARVRQTPNGPARDALFAELDAKLATGEIKSAAEFLTLTAVARLAGIPRTQVARAHASGLITMDALLAGQPLFLASKIGTVLTQLQEEAK